ncbi:9195_t:CDS:2 [Funneliformis geosporum]|nr:9195_t:CDS:2 [Funneliformis geosporum]
MVNEEPQNDKEAILEVEVSATIISDSQEVQQASSYIKLVLNLPFRFLANSFQSSQNTGICDARAEKYSPTKLFAS